MRSVRAHGKAIQVFTSGAVVCRPTQREADEYFHSFAVEHRDEGAIDTLLGLYLSPANQRAMTRAEAEQLRARYGAGYRGLLAVGDPDTVVGTFQQLADAGFDGLCFCWSRASLAGPLSADNLPGSRPLYAATIAAGLAPRCSGSGRSL